MMKFELDKVLADSILFHMENQDGIFLLDTQNVKIIALDDYEGEGDEPDDERFVYLPKWESKDGFILMEKFAVGLKNPVVRQELSAALNEKKGVFRSFKNVLDQYPETAKQWLQFKEKKMQEAVALWYNALRAQWGLQPVGSEPESDTSLVLEDFVFRGAGGHDADAAAALHKACGNSEILKQMNPFAFPGDFCIVAEGAQNEFCGYICAVKDNEDHLRIRQLEVKEHYRGLGLAKALLEKLLAKTEKQFKYITIDLPIESEYFSRALHLENFKPCVQRYIRSLNGNDEKDG
jgi:ribosomal protein S18 acetylase RimI-like enzyme